MIQHRAARHEHGALERYSGNFTAYIAQKEERFTSALRAWEEQQDFIRKEEEFIRRHMGSQRTAEAKGRQKKLENLVRLWKRPVRLETRVGAKALRLAHDGTSPSEEDAGDGAATPTPPARK